MRLPAAGPAPPGGVDTGLCTALRPSLLAQFVPSKALPGGAEGVEALAAAVDLGKALQLTNMDLDSLRDPKRLPQLAEALATRAATQRAKAASGRRSLRRSVSCGGSSFVPACCGGPPAVVGAGEDSRAEEMAAEGVVADRPWWCCFGAPQQPEAAARSSAGAAAKAARHRQGQQPDRDGQQVQQAPPSLQQQSVPDAAAMAEAGTAAEMPSTAARPERSPGKQRSLVHIKRFSTLLLRGSKSAARGSLGSGAALELAEVGGQPAGQPGAAAGPPEEPLSLQSALSHPDSIVADESGSWVYLSDAADGSGSAAGPGRAPSMQRAGSRRPARLDLQ